MNHHIGPEERRQIELIKGVKARLASPPRRRKLKVEPCPDLHFIDMTGRTHKIILLIDHNAHVISRYKFLLGEDKPSRTTSYDIMMEISKETGITIQEMKGARRFRPIAEARQKAMVKVVEDCPWLTISKIGQIFNKDHTTVLHAMKKHGVSRQNPHHKSRAA